MTEGVRVGSEVLVKLGNLTGREKVGGSQRIPLLTFRKDKEWDLEDLGLRIK